MSKRKHGGRDQQLIRALSHPLRVRILDFLSSQVASPVQLSDALGKPLSNVSYHVRYLLDCDCIRLIETRSVRGAVEHFYVAKGLSLASSRAWQEVPSSLRGDVAMTTFDHFAKQLQAAVKGGAFAGRPGAQMTCATARLDDQGWKKVVEIVTTAERSFQRTSKECEQRLRGKPGVPIVLALGLFEAAEGKSG